ncbi:MAG: FtsK/SpoIIIE domain-containing protein [Pseudomonadota bacterium]
MPRSPDAVTADLAAAQERLQQLVTSGSEIAGELQNAATAILKGGAQRLNNEATSYLTALSEQPDYSVLGWDHPAWETYTPSQTPSLDYVRVGERRETQLIDGETGLAEPVPSHLLAQGGALVIQHSGKNAGTARQIMQSVLLRAALQAPGALRFTLLDPAGASEAFPLLRFLPKNAVRDTNRDASNVLAEALQDVRRINERVLGEANDFASLDETQRSGEMFEMIALAGFPKAYSRDIRALESLVTLSKAGARTGRHLLIEWDASQDLPHGFDQNELAVASIIDIDNLNFKPDPAPDIALHKSLVEKAFASTKRSSSGDWDATVRPKAMLKESSLDRVRTPIGERLNFWLGEDERGKPSAHAMIAGQTGSGKSYLLHAIITGLAARYSPDELQLTLIDGKQGVEFEVYRALPHADIISLQTAPALARSVLADFVTEMDERYDTFQQVKSVKLSDYREKTGAVMPRRVLVVDEFQQLLDGDPETGADLLGKLLEKGRAAGMHAVLGSQMYEQPGLPFALMTHVHTFAAMSLNQNYVQGLQTFGQEGKRLIRDLAQQGEVVLNDEGGRDGANARGAVAQLRHADGRRMLPDIVSEIREAVPSAPSPRVLSGREGALPSTNPHLHTPDEAVRDPDALQALARRPTRNGGFGVENWNASDRPVALWLGRKFDVRDHALCVLRRAPQQNLLVMGSQAEARGRMLATALAGIGATASPDTISVSLIDGLRDDMPGGGMLAAGLERLKNGGFVVETVSHELIGEHLSALAERAGNVDPTGPSHILVINDVDYLYDLHRGLDMFSAPTDGPTADLHTILSRGPQGGLHTVLSLSGLSSMTLAFTPGREAMLFNHKAVQQMNEDDSMQLFSSLVASRLSERADHPNAALYVDQIAGPRAATLFHSYTASEDLGAAQSLTMLREALDTIIFAKDVAHVA